MDALVTPDVKDAVDERVLSALKNCPLFRALKPEQIPQLAKAGEIIRFETGDKIISQGEPSDSFFVIMEGDAAVTIDRNGEAVGLGSVPTPVSVGEVGLLLGEPRTATVLARSEVRALKFTARAFEAMFKKIPEFGVALSSGLAYRLHHVSDRQLPAHDAQRAAHRRRPRSSARGAAAAAPRPASEAGGQRSHPGFRGRAHHPGDGGRASAPAQSRAAAASDRCAVLQRSPAEPGWSEGAAPEGGGRGGARKAAFGPARQAARADGGGRRFGPPPFGRAQASLARGRRHAAHRRRLRPRSGGGAGARDSRLREAPP